MANGHPQFPGYGAPHAGPGYPPQPGGQPYPGGPGPYGPPGSGVRPGMSQFGGRRGQSRALPIIVAGGLAIGVFGGLMLVRGTGSSSAAPSGDAGPEDTRDLTYVGTRVADGGARDNVPEVVPIDAGQVVAIDAAPPEPEKVEVVMTFDVDPPDATIEVDDVEVQGKSFTLELGENETSKRVKVRASAPGYRSRSLPVKVTEGMDPVEIRLSRRRGGSNNNNNNGRNNGRDNSDLIDL